MGEQTLARARHRPGGADEKAFVIADGEVTEDLAFECHGDVGQQWRPGRPDPPVDGGELVHRVAGLLAEEPSHADLVVAEEMQSHG